MSLIQLALALVVLLLTPGPTNTLVAIAGAERGWLRALRLIPAEIAGYLATTVPLALAGVQLVALLPGLRPALGTAAAVWVLVLAVRMWRLPASGPERAPAVTAGRILVTTLLNPKALVIGLVLLPSDGPLAPRLALLVLLIGASAACWAGLGAAVGGGAAQPGPRLPASAYRAAALWLALLSAGLAWSALSA